MSHASCYDWVPMCVTLKLIAYSRGHSECYGIKKGYHLSFLINLKSRCHASGKILSLTMSHSFLLHSLNFGFVAQ